MIWFRSNTDKARLGAEILFFFLLIHRILSTLYMIINHRPMAKAVFKFWTLFDIFMLAWSCLTFYTWTMFVFVIAMEEHVGHKLDVRSDVFVDYYNLSEMQRNATE